MKIVDNPIDIYGNPIPKNEQCCSWCGTKIKRNITRIPIDQPTNEIVVRTQKIRTTYDEFGDVYDNSEQVLFKYIWDGVSYRKLKHKHFCKDSCAIAFADAYMIKHFEINEEK